LIYLSFITFEEKLPQFFPFFSFLAFSQECSSGGSASAALLMKAEPPKWHFQAKPGNETVLWDRGYRVYVSLCSPFKYPILEGFEILKTPSGRGAEIPHLGGVRGETQSFEVKCNLCIRGR
jgi:hypothetical protein